MIIRKIQSSGEFEMAAGVMQELRPAFEVDQLAAKMKQLHEKGYQLYAVWSADEIICVGGFWISEKLAWGKHIYIDDLVTAEKHRSTGAGKLLLDKIIDIAKKNNCESVHLDSGVQRFGAHKFYLRNDFHIASHHFSFNLHRESQM